MRIPKRCGRRGWVKGLPIDKIYRPRCYLEQKHGGKCKGYILLQLDNGMQREVFLEFPKPYWMKQRDSLAGSNTICDDIPDSWVK